MYSKEDYFKWDNHLHQQELLEDDRRQQIDEFFERDIVEESHD